MDMVDLTPATAMEGLVEEDMGKLAALSSIHP